MSRRSCSGFFSDQKLVFYETKWLVRRFFGPRKLKKTLKCVELSAKIKVFVFFQGRSKTETQKAPKRVPREAKMSPRS